MTLGGAVAAWACSAAAETAYAADSGSASFVKLLTERLEFTVRKIPALGHHLASLPDIVGGSTALLLLGIVAGGLAAEYAVRLLLNRARLHGFDRLVGHSPLRAFGRAILLDLIAVVAMAIVAYFIMARVGDAQSVGGKLGRQVFQAMLYWRVYNLVFRAWLRPSTPEGRIAPVDDAAARGRITEDKARFLRSIVSGTTTYEGFEDCDFVLEAVFEDMDVKKQVFGELREVVPADCILATNTSSLSVEETDEAILRLGLPMAPSVLLQMVGPRVANHVLETMHEAYPDRFPRSPTLANYAEGKDEIVVVEERPRAVEEITEAVLEAIADEVRHMLDEGVVQEAADVDTALILGAGWPFWLGGVTKYLDQTGVSERVAGAPLAELRAAAPA